MESNHEFYPLLKAEATFAEATGELMDAVSIQVTYFCVLYGELFEAYRGLDPKRTCNGQ